LNSLLGFKWVNTVFWTLAIEFQYYLTVACTFPLLTSKWTSPRIVGAGSGLEGFGELGG